jgi:hypothetical protein
VLAGIRKAITGSTPTIVILANLIPARARRKHSGSQVSSCGDKPRMSAPVGFIFIGRV